MAKSHSLDLRQRLVAAVDQRFCGAEPRNASRSARRARSASASGARFPGASRPPSRATTARRSTSRPMPTSSSPRSPPRPTSRLLSCRRSSRRGVGGSASPLFGASSIAAGSHTKKDCACRRAAAAGREEAREAWFEGQLDLDPDRLVFIDETAATTKMARLRGRAPRGERCVAAVPHDH